MGLETGSFIPELVDSNPDGVDPKSEGDNHLRLIKTCVQGSFGGFVGTTAVPKFVTLTEDQINDAALKTEANVFTELCTFEHPIATSIDGTALFKGAGVILGLQDTSSPIDEGVWDIVAAASQLRLRLSDDPGLVDKTAISIDRTGLNIDAVTLHIGGGEKRIASGVSGTVNVHSDGDTDTENRLIQFVHQVGTLRGFVGFGGGNSTLFLENRISSGLLTISGRDAGAVARNIISGNPDAISSMLGQTEVQLLVGPLSERAFTGAAGAGSSMFFANLLRLETRAGGVVNLRSDGNTDTEARLLSLTHGDGSARGFWGFENSALMEVRNQIIGGNLAIRVTDSGSVLRTMLDISADGISFMRAATEVRLQPNNGIDNGLICRPGGATELYHAGLLNVRTIVSASGGLQVDNSFTGGGFERVLTESDRNFGGFVDATAVAEVLPTGWTAVRNSVGRYTITHNLGLASGNDLAISGTMVDALGDSDNSVTLSVLGVNSFVVETGQGGLLFDSAFMFTAVDTSSL